MSAFDCTRHFQLQLGVTHGAAGRLSKPRRRSPFINCQFHPNRLAIPTFTQSTELPATLWSSLRAFKFPRRLAPQLAGATQSSILSEFASNILLYLDSHLFLTTAAPPSVLKVVGFVREVFLLRLNGVCSCAATLLRSSTLFSQSALPTQSQRQLLFLQLASLLGLGT